VSVVQRVDVFLQVPVPVPHPRRGVGAELRNAFRDARNGAGSVGAGTARGVRCGVLGFDWDVDFYDASDPGEEAGQLLAAGWVVGASDFDSLEEINLEGGVAKASDGEAFLAVVEEWRLFREDPRVGGGGGELVGGVERAVRGL
jgi:hypothetical protein